MKKNESGEEKKGFVSFVSIISHKDYRLGLFVFILLNIFIRYAVSLHPYSGEFEPPKYGDFEAQRHWMEITTKINITDWYKNSTHNDLQYWGLDYPPLTAYHSWICGKIAEWIEPESVALFTSRGYHTPSHRLFMRMTVIISELLVYFTAVYYFISVYYPQTKTNQIVYFVVILLQPALILIDHGHFQYNSVCLGLCVWAVALVMNDRDILGSISFCLALNFKQISLYYAPSFFFYLLGKNFKMYPLKIGIWNIIKIGISVIITFALCWAPFILAGEETVIQVISRIFPLQRGLFEDKVANFWCSVHPILKLKELYAIPQLVRLCTFTTLTMILPTSLSVLTSPTRHNFLWNLCLTSFSFFFFSFHVHEKSILFPIMPLSLLTPMYPSLGSWILLIANLSMYPLLEKESLILPYITLTIGFCYLTQITFKKQHNVLFGVCVFIALILHALPYVLSPPTKLPHLFTLMITTFSFFNFGLAFLYGNYQQWKGLTKIKHN